MVTHDATAASIADRVIFLDDGHDRRPTSRTSTPSRSSTR